MFIAANCFVVVAFFCSRTSRYAYFKNAPSALLFIRSESLLTNPIGGFGFNEPLNESPAASRSGHPGKNTGPSPEKDFIRTKDGGQLGAHSGKRRYVSKRI